ncbi:MAG: hypothetical protein AAFS07_19555, partial [Pseudomonadota bacterium]
MGSHGSVSGALASAAAAAAADAIGTSSSGKAAVGGWVVACSGEQGLGGAEASMPAARSPA